MSERSLFDTLRKVAKLYEKSLNRKIKIDNKMNNEFIKNGSSERYKFLQDAFRDSHNLGMRLGNAARSACTGRKGVDVYACMDFLEGLPPRQFKGWDAEWEKAKNYFENLPNDIELDPLLYVDDENPYIRDYARKIINGTK